MTWNFGAVWPYLPSLFAGAVVTVILTVCVLALGMVTGLFLALARISGFRAAEVGVHVFVDFFRTTPPMVQVLWIYFVLPILIGLDLDAFWAVVLALGLNTGAFASEIFRSGIQAVPRGQRDAARVLGLSTRTTFIRIVWPQALRASLPPLAILAMLTVKATSLASILAVPELTTKGSLIAAATFRPVETFTAVGIAYFAMIFPLSRLTLRIERRFRVSDRGSVRADAPPSEDAAAEAMAGSGSGALP